MPEVRITIGGRSFDVMCQAGQEGFLQAAAGVVDAEATALLSQVGRMTEPRMLLMAGLMLGDQVLSSRERLKAQEVQIADLEARLAKAEADLTSAEAALHAATEQVSLMQTAQALPEGLAARLSGVAAEAEAMADRIEAAADDADTAES